MIRRTRQILKRLLTIFCFFTCMYFIHRTNKTNCCDRTVFHPLCNLLSSLRNIRKQAERRIRRTYYWWNYSPKFGKDDIEMNELIEKYLNATKRVGPLPNVVSHPLNGKEWIDTSEGKRYSYYGDDTCEDNVFRQTLTRIFTKWTEISSKLNISYFLTCGTLLGAWRNGDIIPYDRDMDIIIDQRDAIKLEKIKNPRNFSPYDGNVRLVLQEDWRLPYEKRRRFSCYGRQVTSGECSFQEPLGRVIKDGLHLDIYDYKNVNGILDDPSEGGQKFNVNDIFPLKKCRFLGQVTYCPKSPTAVLFQFYGNNIKNLAPSTMCKKGYWIEKDC